MLLYQLIKRYTTCIVVISAGLFAIAVWVKAKNRGWDNATATATAAAYKDDITPSFDA